jgi:hypothetical protein
LFPSHTLGFRFDMPVATADNSAPEGYKTVHGYYRFTDIFYEWYAFQEKSLDCAFGVGLNEPGIRSRALSECDLQEVRVLKAFIAYDAIVDPEHPLAADHGGLQVYLGTPSSSPLTPSSHTPRLSETTAIFQALFQMGRRG